MSTESYGGVFMEVSHLKPEVVCRLRSGICITSCAHAVEELVINAIDAGATCIAVRVNLQFFKIQVVDNGEGIPADDLKHIGERYMTSKCHSLEDLERLKSGGFRGEALSSLKDVSSILEIVSRHCRSEKTFCKIFKHGHPLSPSVSKEQRPSKGTTITVLDFLHNMPVRRKCISEALDLELCRKCIENIALMHPSVSFSLRSDVTGEVCLQTRKCNSLLSVFTQLFGYEKATHLKEVTKECGGYHVQGYISTEGHVSKDLQFIYVNKRYVSKTKIHKWINKVLGKALFTKQKMYYKDVTPNTLINSPSKTQIRYSIFVLNIICPFSEYDIIFEPRKTMIEFENWSTVMELIQSAVLDFLTSHNLICAPENSDPMLLNVLTSEKPEISGDCFVKIPENYGRDISVENAKNALFSATVKRTSHSGKDGVLNGKESDVSDVIPAGREECTPEAEVNNCKTPRPDLSSDDSSYNSKFSCSQSLVQPIVCGHAIVNRNNNAEKKSFLQGEMNCRKNILCSENIDLNIPSSNENDAEDPLDVRNMLAENDSRSSCFSESKSLAENPLYKESKNRNALQSSATLNNSKLWSVKNPVLLKIPVENSISLLQKHTAQNDKLSSDEFPSPEEIELPDFSVISSKKPILLRVPMKSSLSALERRAKRTQKFTEFKNKYEFNASKKLIKRCGNINKDVRVTGEKSLNKLLNKGNIFKVKNAVVDEQSGLAVELQQETHFPKVSCVQQKNSLDQFLDIGRVTSNKSDNELHNNDVILHKNPPLESMQKANSPLESPKGMPKDEKGSSCLDTTLQLGSDVTELLCKNHLTCQLYPCENKSLNVVNPHFPANPKDSETVPLSTGLFGAYNSGDCTAEHFYVKSKTSNNALGAALEKAKNYLPSHVSNSLNKNEALKITGTEKVEKVHISNGGSPYTTNDCKYISNCSDTKKYVGGKSYVESLFKNQKQSLVLSSEESNTEQSSERDFHHHSIFLKTYREKYGNLHNLWENVSYDNNFLTEPKVMHFSKMKTAMDISCLETFPETQPFFVTEEAKSLGFDPEIDERDSDDKAENEKIRDDTNEGTCKRNCLSADGVFESYNGGDDSDTELGVKTAPQCNDARPVTEESKKSQNEQIITDIPEMSDIEMCAQQGDENLCGDSNMFCDTVLGVNASDVLLVKDSESQESKTVSSEPRCVTIPDSLDGENIVKKCTYEKDSICLSNQNAPRSDELLTAIAVTLTDATKEKENCVFSTTSQDRLDFCLAVQAGLKFDLSGISPDAYQNMFTPNRTLSYESRTPVNDHTCDSLEAGAAVPNDKATDVTFQDLMGSATHLLSEPTDKEQNTALQVKNLYHHSHLHSLNESSYETSQITFANKSGSVHSQMRILEGNDLFKINETFKGVSFENSCTDKIQPTVPFVDPHQPKQLPTNSHSEDLFPSKSVEGFSVNASKQHDTLVNSVAMTLQVPSSYSHCIKRSFNENQNKMEIVLQKPDICANKNNFEFSPNVRNQVSISGAVLPPVSVSSINSHHFVKKIETEITSLSFEGNEKLDQQKDKVQKSSCNDIFLGDDNFSNTQQCRNGAFFNKIRDANQGSLALCSGDKLEQRTKENIILTEKCRSVISSSQSVDKCSAEDQIPGKHFQLSVVVPETNEIPVQLGTDKVCDYKQINHELSKSVESDDGKPAWFPQRDPVTNEVIYLHAVTGNTSYIDPKENLKTYAEKEQYYQKRKPGQEVHSHFFLSHNSTPFLPRPAKLRKKGKHDAVPDGDPAELKDSLLNYLEEQENTDLGRKWNPDKINAVDTQIGEMFSSWENPMFLRCASEIDLPAISIGQPNQLKMYSIINSYRFTKTAFSHLQVIGQVDCKFIACIVQDINETIKGKNLLVLFDQHAVHERIRLEQLIDDLFEENRQGQKAIKAAELSSPVIIHLKQEEIRLLKAYHSKLVLLGLKLSLQKDSQDVEVHTVPTCLIERENNDLKRKRQPVTATVVENLIREWLISLEQTRSTSSVLPKTLIGILNSQACRGAVKFGDPLDISQCQQLMQSLSLCKLPFQCAHGRPSLAPLLDLDKITILDEKWAWKTSRSVAISRQSAKILLEEQLYCCLQEAVLRSDRLCLDFFLMTF